MASSGIDEIIQGNEEKVSKALEEFIANTMETFSFPDLNHHDKRAKLWEALYKIASTTKDQKVLSNCFTAIRILSREKTALNELITDDWFNLIRLHSGLGAPAFVFDPEKELVTVEAQKALCNLIFNSKVAATMSSKNSILTDINTRMQHYSDKKIPEEIRFFDMKVVFLITALCSEIRSKMKEEMAGIEHLLGVLELVIKEAAENATISTGTAPAIALSDRQVDTVCENLKALFNLTLYIDVNDPEDKQLSAKLVSTLRIYLLIPTSGREKTLMLQNNVVNLLNNMPHGSYINLIPTVISEQKLPEKLQFEGHNMTVFYELLVFLKSKFLISPSVSNQHEMLSPVFSVLLRCVNAERVIRKYLRIQILPPLKEVRTRPEEGDTLRAHLCRLLTTPITSLRDLVAEFLFVLCKKNVSRMIKYTGYGNAAGLFAQKGLLGGRRDKGEADYSSDSEDSETEEYAKAKHGINPVIGCYEDPRPNPMENMSEEQKEYEAMKLVELIDNLMKFGAIQPCRVGEDGKPQPIKHILQLQEQIKGQSSANKADGDDSD